MSAKRNREHLDKLFEVIVADMGENDYEDTQGMIAVTTNDRGNVTLHFHGSSRAILDSLRVATEMIKEAAARAVATKRPDPS